MIEVRQASPPDRAAFLGTLLDNLRDTIRERDRGGPHSLDEPSGRYARYAGLCRSILAEAGPETVLIRGEHAFVPTGLASFRAMPFRDVDVERLIGPGDHPRPAPLPALRTVPPEILGPLRTALESAELHPRSALRELPELEAALVCRLALFALQWIRGPDPAGSRHSGTGREQTPQ